MCQVPGSGLLLARAQAPDLATQNAINLFADNNPAYGTADIGSIPPFFSADLSRYEYIDYLKLMYFYNEDMGIQAGSGLVDCLRDWLTTF
jgi:hypothetical protein